MISGLTMAEKRKLHIDDIVYTARSFYRDTIHTDSISVIGLDSETLQSGKCFLICTSLGDSYTEHELPGFFFTRKYRGKRFVVWNIKFDEGSILQNLPALNLTEIRTTNKTVYQGFKYFSIPHKMLKISYGKNAIEIFDIAGFYGMSLQRASERYLSDSKFNLNTEIFTPDYVKDHLDEIIEYCIQDCILTKRLADIMIRKFENFGVYPKKLYSTAYISYKYFSSHCKIPLIKNIYENHKGLLQYAIESYNGGKFEVTEKGSGYFYEYDIVSAYPFQIRNLIDIENAYIIHEKKYCRGAVYGFIKCVIQIPENVYSPVAIKKGFLNIYPVGCFEKCITKTEYEYLLSVGCDIKILDAYWLVVGKKIYPFRKEIDKLMIKKDEYKRCDLDLDYHTIKIFLNSLYGKFVQLIERDNKFYAGRNWNIIYGSVITANCRVQISSMQQNYDSVIAVHTDSIISDKKLPFLSSGILGDMVHEVEGNGVILGSGIYQIGSKTKFRGFPSRISLTDIIRGSSKNMIVENRRPYSWREVNFHGWDNDLINKFVDMKRKVNIRFDKKRIWLDDYNSYDEVFKRNVVSVPIPLLDYFF